jgi:hypothetical protein
MKALIVIERPAVIRQLLEHLGLPAAAPSLRSSPDPPDGSAADPLRAWAYAPLLDDLPVPGPLIG